MHPVFQNWSENIFFARLRPPSPLNLQTVQPPLLVCVPLSPKKDFLVNPYNIKIKSN